jgi:hypothetical protein
VIVDEQHRDFARRTAVGRHREAQLAELERLATALDLMFEQAIADMCALPQLRRLEPRPHLDELPLGKRLRA